MKYIDSDELKAKVKEWRNKLIEFQWEAVNVVLRIIDSLQQEQPSLPSNLDEAAEEQANSFGYMKEDYEYKELIETFKAGAEWMAGQGYTVDGIVFCDKELTGGYKDIVMSIPDELKVNDEVTIQVRKKEEKK